MNLTELSDAQIVTSLEVLVADNRRGEAEIIAYLAEVETRGIHLEQAYASMWDFCLRKLRMTESEAQRRITAARVVLKFPAVLEPLSDGRLSMTSVLLLREHFTEDNVGELVAEASGKTK